MNLELYPHKLASTYSKCYCYIYTYCGNE